MDQNPGHVSTELIFFSGCPNVEKAKSFLLEKGVSSFHMIDQELLPIDEVRRSYSSPTIVKNEAVIVRGPSEGPSCALINWSKVDWEENSSL